MNRSRRGAPTQALTIADTTYVMRTGRVIVQETAEQTRARDDLWELF